MINHTQIGKTSGGPFDPSAARVSFQPGIVPFVLPQNLFAGGQTIQHMGQGFLAQVAAVSASTNYTIQHNLGHPLNCLWVVMAPLNTFQPQPKVTTNANASCVVQFSTAANPVVVAGF